MLCERCKKNEAKAHLVRILKGERIEQWICNTCIKELVEDLFFLPTLEEEEVKGILDKGLINTNEKKKEDQVDILCRGCGLRYSTYKKSGQLGCSKCYDSFYTFIKHSLICVHGECLHIGKIPKSEYEKYSINRKLREKELELKKAIAREEFEEAGIIRDEIKKINEFLMEGTANE